MMKFEPLAVERTAATNGHEMNGQHSHPTQPTVRPSASADLDQHFAAFAAKMAREGLPDSLIRTFRHYYRQLLAGETGFIAGAQALPVTTLPAVAELEDYAAAGQKALDRTVMIKLNGGLGTTMGLDGPKALLPVKEGLSFLAIIAKQTLHLRATHGAALPLIFMNSFNTEAATRAALAEYPTLSQSTPQDFRQHKVPKIWQHDFTPATWSADPEKEWCPPGHGNLYLALYTSGLLSELIEAGYEYAFVANVDNLGATLDLSILGYCAENSIPFLMEVAVRTAADRKGGHLAQQPSLGLILREVAQCPPAEMDAFQDITTYRYFNTNNIWVNLSTLNTLLAQHDGILDLPLIRNQKPVDPTTPDSPPVYQLETAMGQAIALFPGAQAVQVGRERFLPVKSTNDLLALRSDLYLLAEDFTLQRNPARAITDEILINLDEEYYRTVGQLDEHFPHGVPSLVHCRRLEIAGEIYF